jgi:hypothetical protein
MKEDNRFLLGLFWECSNWRLLLVVLAVFTWCLGVGWAIWSYAAAEVEPPGFDPFSYFAKAFYFWEAVDQRKLFNPFNLPPSARPPGTVVMSYPFGMTSSFQSYYFRSIFLPILLLLTAAYIAGADGRKTPYGLVFTLAFALAGMPALYQFQANETLPAIGFWGLEDNFFAGIAGIAIASTTRSVRTTSKAWAVVGASSAALSFLIKPTGLMVMGLVAITWGMFIAGRIEWNPVRLLREPEVRRFALWGTVLGLMMYCVALAAAFSSAYFSPEHMSYASSALAVLRKDFATSIQLNVLLEVLRLSFGYVVLSGLAIALITAAIIRGGRAAAVCASLCLVAGCWFWIFQADLVQIRYFLPFGVMAFLILVPQLLYLLQRGPAFVRVISAILLLLPTAMVSVLLFLPHPPLAMQRSLGVNLSSAVYREEVQQSEAFLSILRHRQAKAAAVYLLDLSPPVRNFAAVLVYETFLDKSLPRINILLSWDWQRPSVFRLKDLSNTHYVAFKPMRDVAAREAILQSVDIATYATETQLMLAWFSQLTSKEGVSVIADVGFRLLEITNQALFDGALQKLRRAYNWREVFLVANPEP